MKNTKMIVFLGLMIALNIALTNVAKLIPGANIVRISVAFIAISASAMMYGPIWAGVAAALADLISFLLFPAGTFFPGFTLSAFIAGALFGLLLYEHKPSILRALIASLLVIVVVDVSLNTVWLFLLIPGKTLLALFVPRFIKSLIMIPIETFVVYELWRLIAKLRPKYII